VVVLLVVVLLVVVSLVVVSLVVVPLAVVPLVAILPHQKLTAELKPSLLWAMSMFSMASKDQLRLLTAVALSS
jgi:hypothetical protein